MKRRQFLRYVAAPALLAAPHVRAQGKQKVTYAHLLDPCYDAVVWSIKNAAATDGSMPGATSIEAANTLEPQKEAETHPADAPEETETPEAPVAPEATEAPEAPQTPEAPEVEKIKAPKASKVPDAPKVKSTETPDATDTPDAPSSDN